jgi:hypothetical protein
LELSSAGTEIYQIEKKRRERKRKKLYHLRCSYAPIVLDGASDFPSPSKGLEREVRIRPVAVGIEGPPADGDNLSCSCVYINTHVSAAVANINGFLKHHTMATVMEHGAEQYHNAPLSLN